MIEKLPQLRNELGMTALNSAMITTQTSSSATRSNWRA